VDVMYPDAEKIVLVQDNLNTHKPAALSISTPPLAVPPSSMTMLGQLPCLGV
jgi:hypothetical protein